ncbi:MAG: signal transduction histidine kinase [Myxococcota bacterium]
MTVHLVDNCDYDQLVYVLSHDLRAPARALRQYVILLREESKGTLNDDANRFMDRLNLVLDKLDERLDAILELSRMARSRGDVRARNPGPVFEASLKEHGVEGTVEPLPDVICDDGRLAFVVNELIDNVREHAGDGARVTISHDGERFWVKDTGVGIPERLYDEVFMVFRPVPHPDSGRAGMGLSCVSRGLRSLDGVIGIDVPEGGGTHVHFTLPLEA